MLVVLRNLIYVHPRQSFLSLLALLPTYSLCLGLTFEGKEGGREGGDFPHAPLLSRFEAAAVLVKY
jgi:hypothetical protein